MPRTYLLDPDGWTIMPSASPTFYVNPATGDDANAGTSAAKPAKTLNGIYKRLVPGAAVLFARGTAYKGNPPGAFTQAGLILGAYGLVTEPRPIWMLDYAQPGGVVHVNGDGSSVVHIDFHQFNHTPGDANFTLNYAAGVGLAIEGNGVLVEGVRWRGFRQGLNVIGPDSTLIRRCVSVDSFTTTGETAEGIYTDNTTNLKIDSCALVGNGWLTSQPALVSAGKWGFNHGMYIDDDSRPFDPVSISNCLVANSAGCGVEGRPGGTLDGNVFIDNGLAGMDAFMGGAAGILTNNVVTSALDRPLPDAARGPGLSVDGFNGVAAGNLAVHVKGGRSGAALNVGVVTSNGYTFGQGSSAAFSGNIVYDYNGFGMTVGAGRETIQTINNIIAVPATAVSFVSNPAFWAAYENVHAASASTPYRIDGAEVTAATWKRAVGEFASLAIPAFVDPTRTVESYSKAIGLDGTAATFYRYAIAQRQGFWDIKYTAAGLNAYLTAGFARKTPVAQPTSQVVPFPVTWPVKGP